MSCLDLLKYISIDRFMSFVYFQLDLIEDENGNDSLLQFLLFFGSIFFFGHCRNGWINMSSILMESINLSKRRSMGNTKQDNQLTKKRKKRISSDLWCSRLIFNSFSSHRQLTSKNVNIAFLIDPSFLGVFFFIAFSVCFIWIASGVSVTVLPSIGYVCFRPT